MHIGLVISALLHLAILGWAVLTIQSQRELRVAEPEPVAIDLVTPAEMTRLRQGVRTAKQMDAEAKEAPKPPETPRKEAAKPTPEAAKPEPPKPEPPKPEPPKPEPVKEEPKPEPPKTEPPKEVAKAEPPKPAEPAKDPIAEKLATVLPDPAVEQARLEEQRKADEQKKAEEARKQAELKKRLDEAKRRKEAEFKKKREDEKRLKEAEAKKQKSFDDHMREQQALLNRIPDKGSPLSNTAPEEPSKNKGPVLGAREGRDKQLSASEIAILGQIIKSCVQSKWNVLGGGESAQGGVVKIRLRFNPDGRFANAPEVMNPQNSPFFLAIQDSALRAVEACQPYPLPPAKYEFWRDMVLNFDPRDMF